MKLVVRRELPARGTASSNWLRGTVGDFLTLQRGFDIVQADAIKGPFPVVSSSGISYYHNESQVEPPGVVIGRKGKIGDAFFLTVPFWPHDTSLWVSDFKKNDPLFVYYYLLSLRLERLDAASAVPTLNRNNVHSLVTVFPPTLAEQEAIATALSDVDALIEALEQLIAKKRHIKQGAMQELLSGKRRLPGFEKKKGTKQTEVGVIPEDWEVELLGSLVRSHNAGVYKKSDLYGVGTNIIGVSDLYRSICVDGQAFNRVPLSREEIAKYTLRCGDLLYGESSLVREGIARTVYVTKKGAGTAFAWHTRRYSVDKQKMYSHFLYYFLESPVARSHMISSSIQTAITGINTIAYFACPVVLPTLAEQEAIATILSDMDAEIEALEAKLEKTRKLKEGMMHELLTGRIRLV